MCVVLATFWKSNPVYTQKLKYESRHTIYYIQLHVFACNLLFPTFIPNGVFKECCKLQLSSYMEITKEQ